MMLEALDMSENGMLGLADDFSSYYNSVDSLLTENWFDSLLEERNSVTSTECPSVTSELSEFDANNRLMATMSDCTPPASPEQVCKRINKNKNKQHKHKKPICQKKWSSLTISEKTQTLEGLMDIVSNQLGLREQLDIIKIISPDAQLLPSDTEFFIDFETLDDRKFELIKAYVEKEVRRKVNTTKKKMESTKQTTSKSRKRNERHQLITEHHKKRSKQKQLLKERNSGLFSREQVIPMASFSNSSDKTDDSDEEIDVLS